MSAPGDSPLDAKRGSLWSRLYHGDTAFDFVGGFRKWLVISGVIIGLGLISLATRSLNFGIDFRGGTAWEVPTTEPSEDVARDAVEPFDLDTPRVQILRGDDADKVRVQADPTGGTAAEREKQREDVAAALAEAFDVDQDTVSVNEVGPSWGEEITEKAFRALIAFLVAIALYITLRFEWKMALASLAALFHDIFVTVGVYSISGFEVTPSTVIAFLTILGYSLYDTIVVFDKVEENTKGLAATGRMTYSDVVNLSMNQVLMRSLNTSLVAILPILSVLVVGSFVLGAVTLQDFGLALMIGLLTGAYSSIYIASPVLAVLKEREPRYASIRNRLVARGGAAPLTPAAAAAGSGAAAAASALAVEAGDAIPERIIPTVRRTGQAPRPRKKRRR